MISVAAVELLLDGDMSPEAISSFVADTKYPMSELRETRRQLADGATMPLVSQLRSGEIRPLVEGRDRYQEPGVSLDSVWAALLYSHSVAIPDPLQDALDRAHGMSPAGEKTLALESLDALTILKPLIDSETVILVPFDLLPDVRLDFRRVEARLEGARGQIFAVLRADSDGELHLRPRVTSHLRGLELVARTGWAVQIKPISPKGLSPLSAYAVKALLKDGRRRFRRKRIQSAFMGRFDSFAIDTLTRVPVPDLSDLSVRDIQLIRDEEAFGHWRRELTAVVAEYERNVDAVVPGAAGVARDRLTSSAEAIERVVNASSALAAIRAGLSTFAVAGSATLASFPILSAQGRRDELGIAVGSSLIDMGRRMIMCERDPMKVSQYRHHRAAEAIFKSASSAEDSWA
jgi:hypothetical protein